MTESKESLFVRPAEVSARTGITLRTLYKAISNGEVPTCVVGRSKYVPRLWLEALERRAAEAAETAKAAKILKLNA